jgi:hypothetical protein
LKPVKATTALKTLLKVLGVSLVIFAIAESTVRVAYYVRNSMVEYSAAVALTRLALSGRPTTHPMP